MDNPALSSVQPGGLFRFPRRPGRRHRQRRTHAACWSTASMWPTATKNWSAAASSKASRCARCATFSAVGDDATPFTPTCRIPPDGFAGTALGAFGSAQGGIPSTVVAPSLLLDDVEIPRLPRRAPPPAAGPRSAAEVNRATARFTARADSAESKGCAPARHALESDARL